MMVFIMLITYIH